MSDSVDAKAGEEPPDAPRPVEPPADRFRSVFFTRAFPYFCVVAPLWTLVLLYFIVTKTTMAVGAISTIVVILTSIIGIFQPPPLPKISLKVVVVAVLVADFVVSVGWVGWIIYSHKREIDVLSMVSLSQNIGVLPDHHATLDATVTEARDTIVLEFKVDDRNPDIGSCFPNTELSVTPDMSGSRGGTVSAKSGEPVSVDLPAGFSKLHLDIVVTNNRGDQNCGVDLSLVSAKLRNK